MIRICLIFHSESLLKNVLIFQGEAFDFLLFVKCFFTYCFYMSPYGKEKTQLSRNEIVVFFHSKLNDIVYRGSIS